MSIWLQSPVHTLPCSRVGDGTWHVEVSPRFLHIQLPPRRGMKTVHVLASLCGRFGTPNLWEADMRRLACLMLLAFSRSRQRYTQLWKRDTLPLCNLLIILQCLIWAESGDLRRAWKSSCSTRFTVNKGENRKTYLFSQQYKFKELYGVCILQEVQVGRKMRHCTVHTAIKMRVHCSRESHSWQAVWGRRPDIWSISTLNF